MPLVPCPECGHQISTQAEICPSCGAPRRQQPPTADDFFNTTLFGKPVPPGGSGKRIAVLLAISIPAFLAVAAIVLPKSAPKSEPKPTDFSQPLFTRAATPVCPVSILADNRQDYGLKAAIHALGDVYGMAEDLQKLGCTQWRAGIAVYVPAKYSQQEPPMLWLPTYQSADFSGEPLLMPRPYLTN